MGKSRKSTIRKFEFYETITDNGIESGYVRLANTQFHSDAVMDLSANSYRVFTYIKFRAKGNKVFTYTYENAIKDYLRNQLQKKRVRHKKTAPEKGAAR